MIRLLSLFSGIGAFEKALERSGIPYDLVNYCEFDKHASKAYSLMHGIAEDKNLGDIRKVDVSILPSDIDLITYGFPCQDISIAGNMKGFSDNGNRTRSGLFFEALRIIESLQPRYAIAENVKNLTSKRFQNEFRIVLETLEQAGYHNYWAVLNAKDYGIPQSRERVFIISIRKDIDDGSFHFPEKQPLNLSLKDLLENNVDPKYYINTGRAMELIRIVSEQNNISDIDPTDGSICNPRIKNISNCIPAKYDSGISLRQSMGTVVVERQPHLLVREATKQGFARAYEGDSINLAFPSSNMRRGRVGKNISHTLTTGCNIAAVESDLRVRKLTPKECFRLMGFDDRDVDILIDNGISNTQLYKMAGNSIVVNVLEAIFKSLFKE